MQSLHMQQIPSTLHSSPLELLRRKSPNVAGGDILASKRVSVVAATTTSTVPQRQKDPKKRVMITGIGLAYVFGNDIDGYYEKLLAEESEITSIDRFGASKFPTRFAGQILDFSSEGYIDGKNDRRLDDCFGTALLQGRRLLIMLASEVQISLRLIRSMLLFWLDHDGTGTFVEEVLDKDRELNIFD